MDHILTHAEVARIQARAMAAIEEERLELMQHRSCAESECHERDRRHRLEHRRLEEIQQRAFDLGYALEKSYQNNQWWVCWLDEERETVASDSAAYWDDAWATATSRMGVHMESRREWPCAGRDCATALLPEAPKTP